MTCKDCIHYDVCYHIEHYGRLIETEEPCGGFKNKADFVEVVRCKDCKYCEQSKYSNVMFCDWHREYFRTKPDDFCSYGERKDAE